MARPTIYSVEAILDSARELVLEAGVGAATIEAIGRSSGAPTGSIYHRFGSRDEMLARLWMRTVRRSQQRFLAALESHLDGTEAAVACALSIFDFAAEEPSDTRLLLSMRRRDLIDQANLGEEMRGELSRLNRPIDKAVGNLAERVFGAKSAVARQLATLAVVDLPYGAVRRLVIAGSKPPSELRAPLERAVRAVLITKGANDAIEP
jgi:AcrR family transcriptional regulator